MCLHRNFYVKKKNTLQNLFIQPMTKKRTVITKSSVAYYVGSSVN